MAQRTCGTCRHFTPYFDFGPEQWDEDEPGSCDWKPPAPPLSWTHVVLEVREGVTADMSASACPQWCQRPTTFGVGMAENLIQTTIEFIDLEKNHD